MLHFMLAQSLLWAVCHIWTWGVFCTPGVCGTPLYDSQHSGRGSRARTVRLCPGSGALTSSWCLSPWCDVSRGRLCLSSGAGWLCICCLCICHLCAVCPEARGWQSAGWAVEGWRFLFHFSAFDLWTCVRLFLSVLSCAQTVWCFMTRKKGKFGHECSQCTQFDIYLSFTWVKDQVLITVIFLESYLWVCSQWVFIVLVWHLGSPYWSHIS